MTDRELRHMNRGELLQMLITQINENQALQERLKAAEAKLHDRQIAVDNAGSLAEAVLSLNGVFDAAEAAAQQYLENIISHNYLQAYLRDVVGLFTDHCNTMNHRNFSVPLHK